MRKIFISHSSNDKDLIDLFVDYILVKGLEIKSSSVFYSSGEGMGVKSGDDFVDSIKDNLQNSDVTIMFISESYKESEICLNEMGAAWVLSKKVYPFIIEPLSFPQVGVLHRNNHISVISNKSSIDDFRDVIKERLGLETVATARWNSAVNKFLDGIIKLNKPKGSSKVDRADYEKILKERDSVLLEYDTLSGELEELKKMNNELIKSKDAKEVKNIKKKYSNESSLDEFESIIVEINQFFNKINNTAVVRTILAEFADVPPAIKYGPFDGYRDEIDEAILNKYIDKDDYSTTRKKPIPQIFDLLNKIDEFERDGDFISLYNDEYEEDFDPKDQGFWKRHFKKY